MGTLGTSLREAVKKLAYGTSVEQLRKRGIKQVNVVGLDRIVVLIEESVNRSLRNKLRGLERSFVADATKNEFLRMLNGTANADPAAELAEMRVRAEEELDDLREQLTQARSQLQDRLSLAADVEADRFRGENQKHARSVQDLFAKFVRSGSTDLSMLRNDVLEYFLGALDHERQAAVAAREAVRNREVELLERRIGKMTQALAENEARLAEAAALRDVDPGVPSIYREVQGLKMGANQYEKKRALMAEIFKANLALQKGIASAAS